MSSAATAEAEVNTLVYAAFNSQLVGIYLMGIYTLIFFGTLYACFSRPKPLNRLVITTVVLLFLTNAVNCGVQWYLGKVALIQHPSSEVAIFIGFYESPQSMWSSYVETVCYFVAAALADGLLIWRCFHIWDRSAWAVVLPTMLLFAELAADVCVIVLIAAYDFVDPSSKSQIVNLLTGVSFLVTFLCTVLCTTLIGYRIHSFSIEGALRQKYRCIIEMLIQSAALYSVVALAYAVAIFVSQRVSQNPELMTTLNVITTYLGTFYGAIAGISPTIMVARVALNHGRDRDSTTTIGSGPPRFKSMTISSWSALPQDEQFDLEPESATTVDAVELSPKEWERMGLKREGTSRNMA
ncbi:hypothetical protein CVT26_000496 [Gymnopilus dilepis]|uniref:Uncharacterized protein n=1 Tax=Gymnopilus dilepis TaxID=231916 RepID=A0A409VH09_9AGAR|nr:hypothetical protein CVT26_000496 [Gymnopilus dilepis]